MSTDTDTLCAEARALNSLVFMLDDILASPVLPVSARKYTLLASGQVHGVSESPEFPPDARQYVSLASDNMRLAIGVVMREIADRLREQATS